VRRGDHLDAIALTLDRAARLRQQKKMTAADAAVISFSALLRPYQLDAQLGVEDSAMTPVRITTPVQRGSMTVVVSEGVVVDVVVGLVVVGQVHAAEGASAWRRAVGAVVLSEHAARTRTAPPKNSAFFQPM
jgi:hypothetical protein